MCLVDYDNRAQGKELISWPRSQQFLDAKRRVLALTLWRRPPSRALQVL